MQDLITSIRSIATLWILTAFLYPLLIFLVGQGLFPYQANGSMIRNSQGDIVGSALIGQTFTAQQYFWGRPSVINYSEGDGATPTGISGASNLAPDNPTLHNRIQTEIKKLQEAGLEPMPDLIYTSGSGLDPHISLAAAEGQIKRVAAARRLSEDKVRSLVSQHTSHRFLGIFGEPGVNVLNLNLALDSL